jgi:hypothetical protein
MSNDFVVSSTSSGSITLLLLFCTLYCRMHSLFMRGARSGVLLFLSAENYLQGTGKYLSEILQTWDWSAQYLNY